MTLFPQVGPCVLPLCHLRDRILKAKVMSIRKPPIPPCPALCQAVLGRGAESDQDSALQGLLSGQGGPRKEYLCSDVGRTSLQEAEN